MPVLAASPAYILERGMPRSPLELRGHRCLRIIEAGRAQQNWSLYDPTGAETTVEVGGGIATDDTGTLVEAVGFGLGIGRVSHHILAAGIAAGSLLAVLPDYHFAAVGVYALIPSGRQRLARVRRLAKLLQVVVARAAVVARAEARAPPPTAA